MWSMIASGMRSEYAYAIIAKAKARGKGWEDYKWTNPLTKRIEPKSVYFELVEGVVVTCGIYRTSEALHAEQPAPGAAQMGSLLPAKSMRPVAPARTSAKAHA